MDKTQDAGSSGLAGVGERAISLLRSLALYALLVAVPVSAYYFAVVDRQAEARSEQAFHALKRVQSEFDTRLEVLDYLLDAPAQDGGPALELRYAEVGVRRRSDPVSDQPAGCPAVAGSGATVCRILGDHSGGAVLRARKKNTELEMTADRLLDAPAALRHFERVVLADSVGKVIASVTGPVDGDPDRVSHRLVPDTVPPVDVRPFLVQAARDRLRTLAGRGGNVSSEANEKTIAAGFTLGEAAELGTEIGGSRYRIYLLPFAPEKPVWREGKLVSPLYLVGIERQSTIADATAALGAEGLWYLLVALLLMIAAWPLMHVLLLGDQEAATRPALATTLISLVFIPALLTLVILVLMARGDEQEAAERRAAAYAGDLATALDRKLTALLHAIDDHAPLFESGRPPADVTTRVLQCDGFRLKRKSGSALPTECRFRGDNPSYCHVAPLTPEADGTRTALPFETLFRTDALGKVTGDPYLTTGGCQPRTKDISLSEREYFLSLERGGGWPLPKPADRSWRAGGVVEQAGRYFAQRIYAKTDGTRTLVLAVPRRNDDVPLRKASGEFAGVYGVASNVRALSAALKPPFLGYAVIDSLSGTVIFHSDDEASLHENFLADTGHDIALTQAVRERRQTRVDGHYRGHRHHFHVEPVSGVPWVVVTYFDTGAVSAPAVGAGLIALAEMIALIATLSVLAILLAVLVQPVCRSGGRNPELWQWLWPQWRLRRRYRTLALMVMPLVILSQIGLWAFNDDMMMTVVITLGAGWVTVWAMLWLSSGYAWHKTGGCIGVRRRWQGPRRDDGSPTPIDTLRELRNAYIPAVMAGVIALAVVPAGGYFLHALPLVEEATLRLEMLATGHSLERRVAAVAGDLRRRAPPGLELQGRPLSLRDRVGSVGSIGICWGYDAMPDCTAIATDGDSPPYPEPTWLLDHFWPVLGGLLPDVASAGPPPAVEDGFRRDRLLVHSRPISHFGTARLIFDAPLPAPMRLLRMYDAGRGPTGIVAMTLAAALALFLAWQLVKLIARRVLGLDVPYLPPLPSLGKDFHDGVNKPLSGQIPARDAWRYALVSPDDRRAPQAPAAFGPITVIGPERLRNGSLALFATPPLLVVGVADAVLLPESRRMLLALIEREISRLSSAGGSSDTALVLTAATPPWPRLCQPTLFPEEDTLPDEAEACRWREVRRHFVGHHTGDGNARPALRLIRRRIIDRRLRQEVADELVALVEMTGNISAAFSAALDAALPFPAGSASPLRDLRDFEQLAMPHVEAQFRCEWSHCTIAERVALHQLARGLLPNPLNRAVLDDLLARRLVVLAPEPQIVCATFRSFVLRAEPAARYLRWTRGFEAGAWTRVRMPFYVLLMLLVAWFSYSFSDAFTTLNAVLAGTLGMIATFGRVTSLVRGARDAEK